MLLIFEKGDKIIFEGHKRECICADEDTAVFGLILDHYYIGDEKVENEGKTTYYGHLIALPNQEEFEENIEYTRID